MKSLNPKNVAKIIKSKNIDSHGIQRKEFHFQYLHMAISFYVVVL